MAIFNQFLLRLSFGLAVGMAMTSPRLVISGFFRNHLYVTLGLTTLACLIGLSAGFVWWPALAAAAVSYLAAACWLYEKARIGLIMLWLVAGFSLLGVFYSPPFVSALTVADDVRPTAISVRAVRIVDRLTAVSSGLVLGITTAAMLLGHSYLNSPGMRISPLNRLLCIGALAIGLHAALTGIALARPLSTGLDSVSITWWMLVCLRWFFGIFGAAALIGMAGQTLRIPNTQSATGILYVAVIAVFTGELAALLLSDWARITL